MVHLAEIVKNLGVPILSLTRFGSNPLTKLADVPLQVSRSKEANQRSLCYEFDYRPPIGGRCPFLCLFK